MNDTELFERAKKVAPGGVHSPVRSFKGMDRPPIFFKSAQGCTLTSVDGKKYVDYCMSFGPLMLGHRDPEVMAAVHEMIDTAWTFGACEPYSLELAEWITREIPWVQKLRFVCSGTEAVMSALRVARGATGRPLVLKFDGCYHGHVDSLLVKSGSGLAGETSTSSAGIPEDVAHGTLICPLDDEQTLAQIFEKRGDRIAAVIVEPLPANYGLLPQRLDFLRKIEQLCKKHGALLIFDEVISGFRVALGGMAEITGIKPDLVTYGKIIGGGFPVGCYGGRKDLMDQVAPVGPVYQAGTLSANPVGMRAGLVSLQKMKKLNIWSVLDQRTQKFAGQLRSGFADKGLDVVSFGSLFWIAAGSGKSTKSTPQIIRRVDQIAPDQATRFKSLFLPALDRGVYLAPNAYEVGFVSLAHSEEILHQTAEILLEVASAR